jgi:hypothetical protein
VSGVSPLYGGSCDIRYRDFVANEIDELLAMDHFDQPHACHCLPETYDSIKSFYTKPWHKSSKIIEIGLRTPFAIHSFRFGNWARGNKIESVLVAGLGNTTTTTTLVYIGVPNQGGVPGKPGQIDYIAFRYPGDLFNLSYKSVWFKPGTWNAPSSDRDCNLTSSSPH